MKIKSLTGQEFIQLLYEKDIEVTSYVFENLKKQIKRFLRNQQLNHSSNAEELALEVISAFYRKKVIPNLQSEPMAYLMTMARRMWYDKKSLNREYSTTDRDLERLMPVDYVFHHTCEDEGLILINNLLNKISEKCRKLLQLAMKYDDAEQICNEMEYSSMNTYYKKKHKCKGRLRTIAEEDEECCIFFNLSKEDRK